MTSQEKQQYVANELKQTKVYLQIDKHTLVECKLNVDAIKIIEIEEAFSNNYIIIDDRTVTRQQVSINANFANKNDASKLIEIASVKAPLSNLLDGPYHNVSQTRDNPDVPLVVSEFDFVLFAKDNPGEKASIQLLFTKDSGESKGE